ncbi:hypothetical protein Fcan01_07170 [Folsomia candida]|uniref:Uncharacterized protein n=1 Tax=Folsomia candida TaxID=158441 RepID=A0A226EJJ3_FOLCA|nr:hypothetical protein Fcan01_07170 [Folsomia candida]
MDGEEEMQPRSSCSENSPACHPTMSQSPAAADEEDDAFLEEPPEMSMAETHPDANMPGFVPDVADKFVKKYVFRSKSKTTQGGYDTVTVVIQERMMDTKAGHGLRVWACAPILAWYFN